MMNKKRLAALALSAVMATSTMSIPVYAGDFSDGATTEAAPAASAFTSDVEAPTAEPTEEAAEAVGDTSESTGTNTGNIAAKDITFYYNEDGIKDGTVTYVLPNGEKVTREGYVYKETPADCLHPATITYAIMIGNDEHYSKAFTVKGSYALGDAGHKWSTWTEYKEGQVPTHNTPGIMITHEVCSVCGEKGEKDGTEENIGKLPHTFSDEISYANIDNVKTDEDGNVVFEEDGTAVLLDKNKTGSYDIVKYCTSEECKAENGGIPVYEVVKHVDVDPTKGVYAMIIDYDKEHIKTDMMGMKFYNPTQQLPLTNFDDIELKDCTVGGWYTVEYFSTEGTDTTNDDVALSRETKYTVPAHHYNVYSTAEFKSAPNAAQCTVRYDNNGDLVVKNNSCYQTIEYYKVDHCQADGCNYGEHKLSSTSVEKGNIPGNHDSDHMISRVAQTAEPAGEHAIELDLYKQIEEQKKDPTLSKLLTYETLLAAIANHDAEDYVKLSAAPDCETGGTVIVSYICVADKETIAKTQEVKVVPTDHVEDVAVRENYVAPTCDKAGSYDAVIKCKYCEKVLESDKKEIPRLTHTNEIKAEYDASGKYVNDYTTDTTAYLKFSGNKVVDTNGEALKNKGAVITDTFNFAIDKENNVKVPFAGKYAMEDTKEFRDDFGVNVWVYTKCAECGKHEIALNKDGAVALKIVDVQKESANGKAGSITLEATYKIQTAGENKGKTIKEEITVPYFSTIEAYNGRLEEQPETPDEKLNGLHWDEDGECRYYVDGEFQKDFSGILEYEGKSFVLNNGVLCRTASGLNLIDDEWYYLTEGRIRTDVTQVVMYDGEWFYVTEGKLDTTVDDLVSYDGETFVYVDGRYAQEGNGLWIGEDGVWYFLSNGRVAKEHTGLAMYDNEWFYVVNGKLAVDYNGTVEYNGGTFKVVGGMVKEQIK